MHAYRAHHPEPRSQQSALLGGTRMMRALPRDPDLSIIDQPRILPPFPPHSYLSMRQAAGSRVVSAVLISPEFHEI